MFLGLIALDHLIDRLTPLWDKFHKVETFIERRHIMGLGAEIEAIYKLEPIVVKAINDLKACEQSPQIQAVIGDFEAGLAVIYAARNRTSASVPTTPPAAA